MRATGVSWGPKTQVFVTLWFTLSLLAIPVVALLLLPNGVVRPLWISPVAAGATYLIALAVRVPFRFKVGRGGWWVVVVGSAAVASARYLLESGPEGRFMFLVAWAGLCGHLAGVGLARARVLPDVPQAAPPRMVWRMSRPQPSLRRAQDEPTEPPYRGY